MTKFIKIKNKKFPLTNSPENPYLDYKNNFSNLELSDKNDYELKVGKKFFNIKSLKKLLYLTKNHYTMESVYPVLNYQNMTEVPDILDISELTSMYGMFYYCKSLLIAPEMDTSNITNMNDMFSKCSKLTTVPELNTSNVTDMSYMFFNCTSLPATFPWIIDCSSIKNVGNMGQMFYGSSVTKVTLNNVKDNIKSQVTSQLLKGDNTLTINFVNIPNYHMTTIYPSTYNTITNVDINTIKTQYPGILNNLTTTKNMFDGCYKLTTINNLDKLDTSNVTSMVQMFKGCNNITSISDLDTSNVTDMSEMFFDCVNLISISNLDTSKVTDMTYMFGGCASLTSIPNLDTSNVAYMNSMFSGCTHLTSIPELDTRKITDMNYMFSGCASITSIPELDTSKVTSMSNMFKNCSQLTTIPELDTSNVGNMLQMFFGCSNLTSIPELDMSKVWNMSEMFAYCTSLPSTFPWPIDCSNMTSISTTNSLTTLRYMLYKSSVTQVTLKNIKESLRSNVTSQYLKGDDTLTINFI